MNSASTMAGLTALAILAWQIGKMTWVIVPTAATAAPETTVAARGVTQPNQTAKGDESGPDIDVIVDQQLFGEPAAQTDSEARKVEKAPETQLNLKLQGIYFSSIDEHSIAIIKRGDGDRKLYRVGDTVAGQARITGIEREQVVLTRGGGREVLPLETGTLDAASASEAKNGASAAMEQRKRLAAYRDRIQKNPQQLRQLMNPSPVRDQSGNLKGYRIEPGQSADLFDVTDLKPGDVVKAIGKTKLDSDQAAMKAMQELGSSSRVELTVERDGAQRRVTLNFANQ